MLIFSHLHQIIVSAELRDFIFNFSHNMLHNLYAPTVPPTEPIVNSMEAKNLVNSGALYSICCPASLGNCLCASHAPAIKRNDDFMTSATSYEYAGFLAGAGLADRDNPPIFTQIIAARSFVFI